MGLIPSWAKEAKFGSRTINARAETLAEKPAFLAPPYGTAAA
ncbi:MAG: SOS response-associated peptidase family protein [Candidatus Thiodiazotropha endolucinida]